MSEIRRACEKRLASLKLLITSLSKPAPIIVNESNKDDLQKIDTLEKVSFLYFYIMLHLKRWFFSFNDTKAVILIFINGVIILA